MVLGSANCVIYGSVTHRNDFSREKNRGRGDSKFYRNDVNLTATILIVACLQGK
mgnify:CR=1 FL=1